MPTATDEATGPRAHWLSSSAHPGPASSPLPPPQGPTCFLVDLAGSHTRVSTGTHTHAFVTCLSY